MDIHKKTRSTLRAMVGFGIASIWSLSAAITSFAAAPFTQLYSFTPELSRPCSALRVASDGTMYGVAGAGNGMIYKVATNGTVSVVHKFVGTEGAPFNRGFTLLANGDLYGATPGNSSHPGVIAQMTPDGTVTVLHSFAGATDPGFSGPILAKDGNFYGATVKSNSAPGVIYRITSSGTYSVLHTFASTEGYGCWAGLCQANDGNLYGITYGPGGGFFRITLAGVFTMLYTMNTSVDGDQLETALIQGTDGNLYGTAAYGGANNAGTAFKVSTSGDFTLLHTFDSSDGTNPIGGLTQASDGDLYGVAYSGGVDNKGTLYRLSTDGSVYSVLYSFTNSTGAYTETGLVQAADGNLYGATYYGGNGSLDNGTIYRISPQGAYSLVNAINLPVPDGYQPETGVVQASDGTLYGTTQLGGIYNRGTVYKLASNGTLTTLHTFNGTDGYWPDALTLGSDGNLYGLASTRLFTITPSGAFSDLHDFNGADGYWGNGLDFASDGFLYGNTPSGGTYGHGTVFKSTTGGALTTLHDFTGADGDMPVGNPYLSTDGSIYGATQRGGTYGDGTVFQLTPSGAITTLHSFKGTDGSTPYSGVVEGPDGALYGTTFAGGTLSFGVVYRVTKGGAYSVLHNMSPSDGTGPGGALVLASDGYLYGAALFSGPNGGSGGTVFRLTTAGVFNVVYPFQGSTDGYEPGDGLLIGQDGALYGTAQLGGTMGGGAVYKINIAPPAAPTGLNAITW